MKLRLEACAMLIICKLVLSFDIAAHRITEVMVAAYTPMTPDGMHLDLKVIPQYAKYLAKRNITNIMPAGSNGESLSLTLSERKALAEAWAAAACPGQRIYVHIGSESIVDSVALAKHAAGVQGISGILAMTPAYFKPTVNFARFPRHCSQSSSHHALLVLSFSRGYRCSAGFSSCTLSVGRQIREDP